MCVFVRVGGGGVLVGNTHTPFFYDSVSLKQNL